MQIETKQKYHTVCNYTARWPATTLDVKPPNGVILDIGGKEEYECFKRIGTKVNVGWFKGGCSRTIIANYSLLKEDEKQWHSMSKNGKMQPKGSIMGHHRAKDLT